MWKKLTLCSWLPASCKNQKKIRESAIFPCSSLLCNFLVGWNQIDSAYQVLPSILHDNVHCFSLIFSYRNFAHFASGLRLGKARFPSHRHWVPKRYRRGWYWRRGSQNFPENLNETRNGLQARHQSCGSNTRRQQY